MRILQINSFFSTGGPPRIVQGIYTTLEEHGHSCILAAGREKPIDGMNVIKIGSSLNKYIHSAVTRIFDAEGLSSVYATKQLIKRIKEYKPDIIQIHNLHGYYINYEILFQFLKEYKTPVVWTLHDCWSFTGHCAYFDYADCEKWKSNCFNCTQKKNYPKSILFEASNRNFEKKRKSFCDVNNLTIVTPSNWLATLVKDSFLNKYPIKVIHNGIDLNLFRPTKGFFREKYGLNKKIIILGVAQVWGERKGFDYFIELSKIVGDNFKIVMVGLSEKEKNIIPKNIIGITRTDSVKELVEIYTDADVFINPTLEDNFPTTNLEALACGTPIITFRTGGSIECIDETCGLVVEKRDLDGIVSALKSLSSKNFLSSSCLERAEKFEKSAKYNEYINLYNSILNTNY